MASPFTWSSLPPLKKSWVRIPSVIWIHLLFFLFNISITSSLSSSSSSRISYRQHCNSLVPESTPNYVDLSPPNFLHLENGYYFGGDKILGQDSQSSFDSPKAFAVRIRNLYRTDTDGVLKLEARLTLRGPNAYPFLGNLTFGRSLRTRSHRFPVRRGRMSFWLDGFWSESAGKLCMVGSGSGYSKEGNLLDLSAVFKLNYPKNSTIVTSLVNGTLESLDTADNSNYFEPISVLVFSQRNYEYTLVSKENESGCLGVDYDQQNSSLSLERGKGICSVLLNSAESFELEHGSDCDSSKNCSFLGRSVGFLPAFMSFSGVQCSDKQRLRLLLGFSNTSYYMYNQPSVPKVMLVGEGLWDGKKNRLCIAACRILNFTDSLVNASVRDCSIRLSLRFPAVYTIRNRSSFVGQIWSNRSTNDSGYFDRIMFRSSMDYGRVEVPGLTYEYTETGRVTKSCAKKTAVQNKGKRYPDANSYEMRFDMSVKNSQGKHAWGYSVPLSVANQFFEHSLSIESEDSLSVLPMPPEPVVFNHSGLLNISYSLSFNPPPDFKLGGWLSSTEMSSSLNPRIEISAEGIYNAETGDLCMVGCWNLPPNRRKSTKNNSIDCELLINLQFPPLNAKSGDYIKGTIESSRGKSDPLYFERLELSSTAIYTRQAGESVWRMDLEITMVLISNTLACVFVGLQLFYVKKNPDVLPSVSLVMLVILTLGHMIPLVLNFEALFLTNRNRQNVLIGSGGWLEVNEVIVRVVTMVAFLLQFRLLQLAWSTRLADGSQKGLWVTEKKALSVLLSLYLVGGLIAWIVHWWNNYYEAPLLHGQFADAYEMHSLLGDLRSYAGFVLDGFLLPQILFNLFWNSRDKALAYSFYVGTTVVRLLPHAYDLYRGHGNTPYFDVSYIYANPGGDFYSTAWDLIIPCGGLLFAVLIYLQQRFGGRCILPPRFREFAVYEKVPVASDE